MTKTHIPPVYLASMARGTLCRAARINGARRRSLHQVWRAVGRRLRRDAALRSDESAIAAEIGAICGLFLIGD